LQLFDNESVIAQGKGSFPTLTTHRLWYEVNAGSEKVAKCIFLNDLCYCGVLHKEKAMWLVFAVLAGLSSVIGAASNQRDAVGIIFLGGIVFALCFAAYRSSKRQYLTFAAASGRIAIELQGDAFERALGFIEAVAAAKNAKFQADLSARLGSTAQPYSAC
jgi:hypothetical protein